MIREFVALLVDPIVECFDVEGEGPTITVCLGGEPEQSDVPALRVRLTVRTKRYGGLSVLALDAYAESQLLADELLDRAFEAIRSEIAGLHKAANEAEARPAVWNIHVGELSLARDDDRSCMVASAKLLFDWGEKHGPD